MLLTNLNDVIHSVEILMPQEMMSSVVCFDTMRVERMEGESYYVYKYILFI